MNHPGFSRIAASLVTLLLMASSAWTQLSSATAVNATPVPHLVSYSGTLKDASGKPGTGITGVTFLICRDAEGGAPVWMETQNVKPDGSGRYTAQLGATRSDGLPPETSLTGEARCLAVRAAGAPEQPPVPLVAVPYAMKAPDADTIGGLPASATKMTNHRFAIRTDKPNVEVSWQVTGVRHDAGADAHRIPLEQDKATRDRGLYLPP